MPDLIRLARRRGALTLLSLLVGLAHVALWGIAQAQPQTLPDPGQNRRVSVRALDAAHQVTLSSAAVLDAVSVPAAAGAVAATSSAIAAGQPAPSALHAAGPVHTRKRPPAPHAPRAEGSLAMPAPLPDRVRAAPQAGDGTAHLAESSPIAPSDPAVDIAIATDTAALVSTPSAHASANPRLLAAAETGSAPASVTPGLNAARSAVPATRSATAGEAPTSPAIPTSALRLPAPAQLRYSVQRGAISGEGELTWRHDGHNYGLDLIARVPLFGAIFEQHSRGVIDPAGIAPVRFTEKRIGKSERAVNFVRPEDGSAGYVGFSGRSHRLPLAPGMQDRLSWMAQLAARMLTLTTELHPGQRIIMPVAGPAGDVQDWRFLVKDSSTLDGERVWHLLREPDQPYDTLAEVWVSPQRGQFPVRVRMTETTGDPLELNLK